MIADALADDAHEAGRFGEADDVLECACQFPDQRAQKHVTVERHVQQGQRVVLRCVRHLTILRLMGLTCHPAWAHASVILVCRAAAHHLSPIGQCSESADIASHDKAGRCDELSGNNGLIEMGGRTRR